MAIVMKKSWFKQLGGFDTGMQVWGGEQIELSVKVSYYCSVLNSIQALYIEHFKSILHGTYTKNRNYLRRLSCVNLIQFLNTCTMYIPC